MFRVTFVVTNVELVVVHRTSLNHPLKETYGRRGWIAFRWGSYSPPSRVSKHFMPNEKEMQASCKPLGLQDLELPNPLLGYLAPLVNGWPTDPQQISKRLDGPSKFDSLFFRHPSSIS